MEKRVNLLFVCVRNRVRSPFSEFIFRKMLKEKKEGLDDRIKVCSVGFFPPVLRDRLADLRISLPEPIFGTSMSGATEEELRKRGFDAPAGWTSRELAPDDVENSRLIIISLPQQKEELLKLFPEARHKVFTLREMAGRDQPLVNEIFSNFPLDDTFWWYCEENPAYVSNMLLDLEEALIEAFPKILRQLGVGNTEKFTTTTLSS